MNVKLYFYVKLLQFVLGPGQSDSLKRLDLKRGTQPRLEIIPLDDDCVTPIQLPNSSLLDMRLGIKPKDKFDIDPYAISTDFQKPGIGETSYFVSPIIDSDQLDDDLNVNDTSNDDVPYVDGYLELYYAVPGNYPVKSLSLFTRIFNDVVRGVEEIPASALSSYPPASAVNDLLQDAWLYVSAPSAKEDFSMFGGSAPSMGQYQSLTNTHLYVIKGGMTSWLRAPVGIW